MTKYILAILMLSLCVFWAVVSLCSPKLNEYPASLYICDKNGEPMRTILGDGDVRCNPVALSKTGDWIVKALIAAEDKRFYRHSGVDTIAATRALGQNIWSGKIISGASTISSQVIRMSSPRKRTVSTKVIETLSAIQMERSLSKDDILEQYLNRMPVGGNLHGIQVAARKYFGKEAADLSLAEAALVAGLPQAPSRFRPDRRLKRALKRREFVLERMQKLGFISKEERIEAEQQILDVRIHPDKFSSPHFCELVLNELDNVAESKNYQVGTTLNSEIQQIAEKVLTQHKEKLNQKSIFGGAVVVIEVKTGNVVAMLGSPDYDDNEHAGKVNCAIMPRSPGSALKPFAYAMAFDNGMITPSTILDDAPLYFKDYTPQNFDYKFRGEVSARTALVDSLNIPALSIVNKIGLDNFVVELRDLGLDSLEQPALHYGLSVVLGTGEVKLLNLVNAYACLARQGIYMPYNLLPNENVVKEKHIFSNGAAWMIAEILSGNERSMAVAGHLADVALPRIAWKTGTSSGCRDAWTVGYNPEYVIGVWLGNPSGAGTDRMVGIEDAAPIVMDIFRRIYPDGRSPWYDQPEMVKITRKTVLCAVQPQDSKTVLCAVQPQDRALRYEPTTEDFYMPGITDPALLQPKQFTHTRNKENKLRIVKPQNGETFILSEDLSPAVQRIELQAVAASELCWFVDGSLIAKSAHPISWQLQKGHHEIVCASVSGKSDSVNITVE